MRHGADPNEKDNEGIAVIELAKDDATRQVLKEAIHYAASKISKRQLEHPKDAEGTVFTGV